MGSYANQWKDENHCLSFPEEVEKSIFGRDFLSPRSTIVFGIKNYPSAHMSSCSDDLALLLPHLDL